MVDPKIWGPPTWKFLHSITLAYPNNPTTEDKYNIKKFFDCFEYVLPCETCKNNFRKHMEQMPLTDHVLSSKQTFIDWMIDLHNLVNVSTNKKVLSKQEAYMAILGEPKRDYTSLLIALCLLFVAVMAICISMKS